MSPSAAAPKDLDTFWSHVRSTLPGLPEARPEAWGFGATAEHADSLLALVLAGTKTGTASALWDLEATGEPVPAEGELSIILDGRGRPRAVIRTTSIRIVPFDEVDAEHARSEGEGGGTLQAWRDIHERFWTEHAESDRGLSERMPIVCERFELVFAAP